MRPVRYKKILAFLLVLLLMIFFGALCAEGVRFKIASIVAPLWKFSKRFRPQESQHALKMSQLEIENHLLRGECARLRKVGSGAVGKTVLAHVIYRDPKSWNSRVWVDVGQKTNEELGEPIVAKNSCVVLGKAVVGIVDYVGKKQSRVKLLTDPDLHPSVRSVRGELKNQALIEHLDVIIPFLSQNQEYAALFTRIQKRLEEEKGTLYLAKGYLQGTAPPLWRKVGAQLIGRGFNYDFGDDKGISRAITLENPKALLQEGDLLVTTGMDGVFPPDLYVAFVTKVYPLREGDVSYQLEAKPYVPNLDRLTDCIITPPLEFDFEDL